MGSQELPKTEEQQDDSSTDAELAGSERRWQRTCAHPTPEKAGEATDGPPSTLEALLHVARRRLGERVVSDHQEIAGTKVESCD